MIVKMFSMKKIVSLATLSARTFSSNSRKEVLISQSRDMLSNIALEDWVSKNANLGNKTVLVLSNNITKKNSAEIKATLLDSQSFWKVADFDSLILSSITPSLSLTKLPELRHEKLDQTCTGYSVHLDLADEVKTRDVLDTLEIIGWRFLSGDVVMEKYDCPVHLSFVRPDDGWFPGLGKIRKDLALQMNHIGDVDDTQYPEEVEQPENCQPNQTSFGYL